MRLLAHLMRAKLQKLECSRTVADDFGVHAENKHTHDTQEMHIMS